MTLKPEHRVWRKCGVAFPCFDQSDDDSTIMKTFIQKQVQTIHSLICDRCAKEFVINDSEFYEFVSIDFKAGYGSIFGDGCQVTMDLCQYCLKDIPSIFLASQ
jgi:antitoxin CcdA